MSPSCTISEILSLVSQHFRQLTWLWTHPFWVRYHECTSTHMYQSLHEIWCAYLYQFQWYDEGKIFFKPVTWPKPRPLGVVCHPKASTWYLHTKFGDSRFGRSVLRVSKLKMGHVTLTTPLLGMDCYPYTRVHTVCQCAKFDHSSFRRSRGMTAWCPQTCKWFT